MAHRSREVEDEGNGADRCGSYQVIRTVSAQTTENVLATKQLIRTIDEKMDKLIDVVSGSGMMPIESFKKVLIFLMVFIFAFIFGVEAIRELVKLIFAK